MLSRGVGARQTSGPGGSTGDGASGDSLDQAADRYGSWWRLWRGVGGLGLLAVGVFVLAGCVADPPPLIGTALPGDGKAIVSWHAPLAAPSPITGYVVTPYIDQDAQTPTPFNSTATTEVVTGLTNGTTYTFQVEAVNSRGDESAWSDMSNAVTPVRVVAGMSAGLRHTCAVVAAGAVECWGDDLSGDLGDGNFSGSLTPVMVKNLTGASVVGLGYYHSCAIVAGGAMDCWGENGSGELGNGRTTDSYTPVTVSGMTGAVAVAAGYEYTCDVVAGGSVDCWGADNYGQLGFTPSQGHPNSTIPVPVAGISGATALTAGGRYTCAIVTGGAVDCWGYNPYGLGDGTTTESASPVTVSGITGATALSARALHTCALVAGGAVDCWGDNSNGQLGDGTTTNAPTPVAVSGMTDASAVAVGGFHTCAIVSGGSVDCWGENTNGQLGDGVTVDSPTPVAVSGMTTATGLTAGDNHTCAIVTGPDAECWGLGPYLGDGTTTDSSTPVAVSWP